MYSLTDVVSEGTGMDFLALGGGGAALVFPDKLPNIELELCWPKAKMSFKSLLDVEFSSKSKISGKLRLGFRWSTKLVLAIRSAGFLKESMKLLFFISSV